MSDSVETHTHLILLVEDDPSLLGALREFLTDHGKATMQATTREEGELLLRRHLPRVCVLDMNLPDGSGVDLLKMIDAEKLPVKVIVMSAFPMAHLRKRYSTQVLAALLTKPVFPEQLLDLVERLLLDP